MGDFRSSRAVISCLGSVAVAAVVAGVVASEQAPEGQKQSQKAAEPYAGFKADQALLRKTVVLPQRGGRTETVKASSVEACAAARRIFERVAFLFRTRDEVLELLGDPATISDYNKPAVKDPSSPLVYMFDRGFGGAIYVIGFDDEGRVNRVEAGGLN